MGETDELMDWLSDKESEATQAEKQGALEAEELYEENHVWPRVMCCGCGELEAVSFAPPLCDRCGPQIAD